MKIHSCLLAAALLGTPAQGIELLASSFGGCGNSSSPSYVTTGSFDPSGARPIGSADTIVCPGPLAYEYRTVVAGTPRAVLLHKLPGVVTLMAVPDVPGWSWTETTDLATWSPVVGGGENPVLLPIDSARRFFRLENPDLP